MGKKSIKENKNIYQLCREEAELTRDKASEKMEYISSDRIEKIESEKSLPRPEEILAMSKAYAKPALCNYFCSHECSIGQQYVPEVKEKELSQIVLEMLASLNTLSKERERLIEITVDNEITADEYRDFNKILTELKKISLSSSTLQFWLEKKMLDGKIDRNEFITK